MPFLFLKHLIYIYAIPFCSSGVGCQTLHNAPAVAHRSLRGKGSALRMKAFGGVEG